MEVTNKTLVQGLKSRLNQAKAEWVEHLSHILWSYKTTPWTTNGKTPYSLVYGSEGLIPAKIGVLTPRTMYYDQGENNGELRANLDLLIG